MALTTQISEQFDGPYGNPHISALAQELQRAGCHHLVALKRVTNVADFTFVWVWKTKSGNTGHYVTEEPKPTDEQLTAMFAAIKLTD